MFCSQLATLLNFIRRMSFKKCADVATVALCLLVREWDWFKHLWEPDFYANLTPFSQRCTEIG